MHCSIRTEQSYVDWIKRFILFHGKRLSAMPLTTRYPIAAQLLEGGDQIGAVK